MAGWQVGAEHLVKITGLSHDGQGVGRVDGRVAFVPQSLPGDEVRIRLIEAKRRLGFGELLEVVKSSPDRKQPSCPHAHLCGGCQLQPLNYQAQLRWKRKQVADALERIGGLETVVLPTLGMKQPYHYRNKAQFPLGQEQGQVVLGFFRRGSHSIVDITTCELQHPLILKLAAAVKAAVGRLGIEPYEPSTHQGVLRHAVIRVSFSRHQLSLILVTRTRGLPCRDQLVQELTKEVPELVSIAHNVNGKRSSAVLGRETEIIWGQEYLVDSIGHLNYAISPTSFFQVNPSQTKVLYDLVQQNLNLSGRETILDLYCGAGTIGLYLASRAGNVMGVETVPAAVADARRNAQLNGITNAEFVLGRAEEQLPKLLKKYGQIDGAVLDPPRKGCDAAVLDALAHAQVRQLVYVSCNPATLARDLHRLTTLGYQVGPVQPVDMFPWTSHVECVTLMSRVEK